jgi:hypothetical protein
MLERLAAGDYEGALIAAEALLLYQPDHADARDCAQIARSELRKVYLARLGGALARVPYLAVGPRGLVAMSLDFRAGFLLSRVDGRTAVSTIVEASGLPELDSLRILSELVLESTIAFKD